MFCYVAYGGLQQLCLALQVQVKVQYSDAAGSFLHTSSAKQVSVVLRHGHRPGTAEIDIDLPKAVRARSRSHLYPCLAGSYKSADASMEAGP